MSEGRSLNRRQFIRLGGLAASSFAFGELTSACAGKTRHTTHHGSSDNIGEAPWSDLHTAISGRVVVPGDPDYSSGAILYNERFDAARPAAIAYCANPSDVQRSIEFVRKWDVDVSVRSGGHSYGGYSTGPGLVIDVTPMSEVVVSQESARIGAGTRLIDMYSALASAGVAVPGGSCPTVGIAGLALGGGIGVLGRKFGLSCDNVTSLQIVTADSRILTCDASDNEDLYWASRGGGGGNFGVVTSFDFAVHPLPQLALFTLEWPWAAAGEVLGAWQEWIGPAVNELWSNCQLLSAGSGGTKVRVTGVFCGDSSTLSEQLQPLLRTVGTPSYQFLGPESFTRAMLIEAGCEGLSVAQCHLPSQNAAGQLSRSAFAAKSVFIDSPLPSQTDTAIVEGDHPIPGEGSRPRRCRRLGLLWRCHLRDSARGNGFRAPQSPRRYRAQCVVVSRLCIGIVSRCRLVIAAR